eukprot:755883-Hanusia_phi.AAC.4
MLTIGSKYIERDDRLTFDPETFAGLQRVAGADISCSRENNAVVGDGEEDEYPAMKAIYPEPLNLSWSDKTS